MPDFNDPKNLKRLRDSISWSDKKLEKFKKDRMDVLRHFVGHYYGDGGHSNKIPINLIESQVTILQRKIQISNPEALVTTDYKELMPTAKEFGLLLSKRLKQLSFEYAVNSAGYEAQFSMGTLMIGLVDGELFCYPVLFDDLILDMNAKTWTELGYVGNRFTMPIDEILESKNFNKKTREAARSVKKNANNPFSTTNQDSSHSLSTGEDNSRTEDFVDVADLIQVYVPSEKIVIIDYEETHQGEPLQIIPWKGPEVEPYRVGMYRFLSYIDVPGNIIPVSQVQIIRDLHEGANALADKAIIQADRQKTVTLVQTANRSDGEAIVNASDGEAVPVSMIGSVQEVSYGGANQQSLGTTQWLKSMANYMSGNLDAVAGLAAQTQTVGQDSMLRESAGSLVEDMRARMMSFAGKAIEDIAYWTWTDPLIQEKLNFPLAGTNISVPFIWTPSRKKGEFFQYNFEINPYSSVRATPQQRLSNILTLVDRLLANPIVAQMLNQQGLSLDVEALFEIISEYGNLPELKKLFIFSTPQSAVESPMESMPGISRMPRRPDNRRPPEEMDSSRAMEKKMMDKIASYATAGGGGANNEG